MKFPIQTFLFILISFHPLAKCSFDFTSRFRRQAVSLKPYNYNIISKWGPPKWGDNYPKCYGSKQSPINIDLNNVQEADFPTHLRTTNIDTKPLEIEMRNNGYTAYAMYYWACCAPKMYGGPLKYVYEFIGLHFHWGKDDKSGTEHSVNGEHDAMECHMIFKNTKYGTKEEALEHSDGLCVLALRYTCDPNAEFFDILEAIQMIPEWGNTVKAFYPTTIPLTELIVSGNFSYAYYEGSLTTPPCSESVQWIVNLNRIPMNCEQLDYFRAMTDAHDNPISGNYRQVQNLNDRLVYIS
uniref:CSON002522 protein n=1 Tax=Culicoides sonorensis TaxID=179676 RepID=A0A336LSJ7_CULSO